MCCASLLSHVWLCAIPWTVACQLLCPGKNTGVGCHALLQGIFPTQRLNPGRFFTVWVTREVHEYWMASLSLLQSSSWRRNWTGVSYVAGGFFTSWATREALINLLRIYLFNLYLLTFTECLLMTSIILGGDWIASVNKTNTILSLYDPIFYHNILIVSHENFTSKNRKHLNI